MIGDNLFNTHSSGDHNFDREAMKRLLKRLKEKNHEPDTHAKRNASGTSQTPAKDAERS